MEKNFRYDFDADSGILYKYYFGLITIRDIVSSWKYAFENNLIPINKKGFILDYRNASFDIAIDEHPKIAEFYKSHLDVFGNFKIAVITNEPKDVVIPILVETMDDGYISSPFSTLEGAIEWVLR